METILDEELPRSRLAVLLKRFSQIEDGRQSWRVAFPLAEMLLLLTCANRSLKAYSARNAATTWRNSRARS